MKSSVARFSVTVCRGTLKLGLYRGTLGVWFCRKRGVANDANALWRNLVGVLSSLHASYSEKPQLASPHKRQSQETSLNDKSGLSNSIQYSEACIKRPLEFVVSQDRWRINMILLKPCQANDEILCFGKVSRSQYTGSTVFVSGIRCVEITSHITVQHPPTLMIWVRTRFLSIVSFITWTSS